MSLLDAVGTALGTMNSAIEAAGPIATASGATALTASQAITAAITATQAYITSISSSATTYQATQAQALLANLQIIQKNFSAGQAPLTITVTGGSLHEIAQQYTGDATNALAIMQANGLISPFLPYGSVNNPITTPLVIPPYQPASPNS